MARARFQLLFGLTLVAATGCTQPGAAALCDAIRARDVTKAQEVVRAGPVEWLRQQWTCQPAKDVIQLAATGAREGTEILRVMLEAGLDPNATYNVSSSDQNSNVRRSTSSTTTVSLAEAAAWSGAADAVTVLLRAGLDVKSSRTAGAVIAASYGGCLPIVQALVDAGASVSATADNGVSALGAATSERHHPVIAYLESKRASESSGPHSAVFRAARLGDVAAVKAALSSGLDPNVEEAHADSLLLRASAFGQVSVVEALLSAKADPNHWSMGESPLQAAAIEGHADVVRALLKGRASVNARADESSNTALVIAVQARRPDVVSALLAGGADHRIPGIGGTALMLAVQQKHLPIVQALLKSGANPNVRTLSNEPSALHVAVVGCENRDFDVPLVHALVAGGADLAAKDAGGQTPLQNAESRLQGEERRFYRDCYQARVAALKKLGG